MPGMGGSPILLANPLVVAVFRHLLFFTSLLWIMVVGVVIILGAVLSKRVFVFNLSDAGMNEPRSRSYLRWGFGALWLVDGLLQFQPSMPLGLANDVVAPASYGTPSWLHALMYAGIGLWNTHPIALAAATAWLQVGIGLVLIVSNGSISRVAGAVSVVWAMLVWLIGNGAGGIFSSTGSILFGWPGAPLFYAAAGLWLVTAPDWFQQHFARLTTRSLSVFLAVAALVQLLPSRGFWRGGNANALTLMSTLMTKTPQPHWLEWIVHEAGVIAGTMGGGFNVVVIMWLVAGAVGLWLSTSRDIRWPVWTVVIGALLFWVVGEDMAIFGGLATDLNSLVPLALLTWCAAPRELNAAPRTKRLPKEMRSSSGAVAASFAAAMMIVSVTSGAWSSFASAENSFYLAQNGSASSLNSAAPSFTLIDQHGAPYRLGEHRGRYTLLTFLDPVCWTDCPLLANQMKSVAQELPRAKLDLVAVAIDPYHETLRDVNHFIERRDLGGLKHFYFVTSPDVRLMRSVWKKYGISVLMTKTSKMSVHSDFMFIVGPGGQLKWAVPDDPLSNWSGQRSAVSELVALLAQSGLR